MNLILSVPKSTGRSLNSISATAFFNVAFQKWLKSNAGKTYKDAVDAYYAIFEEKKNGKTKIDKQFEYNTYIRDFLKITKESHLMMQ